MSEKTVIALLYDFDKTLCTQDMQNYSFIPSLGMAPGDFWREANAFCAGNQMDGILTYMYMMVRKSQEKGVALTRESLRHSGRDISFFPGVTDWFDRITKFGELLGVEVSEAPKKAEEPKEQPRRGFGARRQAAAEPAKPAFETVNYTLRFTARPLAVVKTLNAFTASAHLMYVEDLSLVREKDMLGEMLGAGKKEAEAGGRRSRARRGRRNEEEQQAAEGEEQARKGLVTDPQIEAPFVVTLRVATIDFGTNGAPADAADADGKGKSDEKEEEE